MNLLRLQGIRLTQALEADEGRFDDSIQFLLRAGLVTTLVVAVFAVLACAYTLDETEQAIIVRLGNPNRVVDAPGLHFKWPIAEDVKRADARVLTLDSQPETYFTHSRHAS